MRYDYSTYENIKERLDAIYESSESKDKEFKTPFELGACKAELKRLYLALKDIENILNE